MKSRKRQWYVVAKERETCIRVTPDTSGPVVAIVRDAGGTDDVNEVAALIAAAPELLDAANMVRDANQRTADGVTISLSTYAEILAAIAKATGGG